MHSQYEEKRVIQCTIALLVYILSSHAQLVYILVIVEKGVRRGESRWGNIFFTSSLTLRQLVQLQSSMNIGLPADTDLFILMLHDQIFTQDIGRRTLLSPFLSKILILLFSRIMIPKTSSFQSFASAYIMFSHSRWRLSLMMTPSFQSFASCIHHVYEFSISSSSPILSQVMCP